MEYKFNLNSNCEIKGDYIDLFPYLKFPYLASFLSCASTPWFKGFATSVIYRIKGLVFDLLSYSMYAAPFASIRAMHEVQCHPLNLNPPSPPCRIVDGSSRVSITQPPAMVMPSQQSPTSQANHNYALMPWVHLGPTQWLTHGMSHFPLCIELIHLFRIY